MCRTLAPRGQHEGHNSVHAYYFGCAALALLLAGSAAQAQDAARLPDLSSYDCAALDPAAVVNVRHIGQVIESRYYEWDAFYVGAAGQRRLACIGLVKPDATRLSRDAAADFLERSLNIGAPSAASREATQSIPAEPEPEGVLVEPLLSPRRSDLESTSSTPDQSDELPPLPASKSADEVSAVVPAAPRERANARESAQAVGVEDRVAVANTRAYPWNTVGYLTVTYPNGQSYRCSGTLVSPYVVLTAGHCVHNNSRGGDGYVVQVRFSPGQSQAMLGDGLPQRPYGSKVDFAFIRATQGWTRISGQESYPTNEYRHDFAAIQFRTPFTFTGTFMPIVYGSTDGPITSAGYPGTYSSRSALGMYTHTAPERVSNFLRNSHVRQFLIDASGGNSGGPFFYADPETNQHALVGNLSYGDDFDDLAGGPWYDGWNQALLTSWVTWTPDSPSLAAPAAGLNVPGVLSGAQAASQSYLRFHNPTGTAGTVQVTLADSGTGTLLATWTSPQVRSGASLQYYIRDIEAGADRAFERPPHYSLAIRSSFGGYFQHVLWQPALTKLTNLSTCDDIATAGARRLMAVHSSRLSMLPSTLVIQNTAAAPQNFGFGIYDARNGNRLGTFVTGALGPSAQRIVSVSEVEAAAGITPTSSMYHYVVALDAGSDVMLQHVVTNTATGAIEDMTKLCAMPN